MKLLAALRVAGLDPVNKFVFVTGQAGDLDVIDDSGAMLRSRRDQIDKEPRIVELAVVIHDAAAQAFGFE